MKYDDRHSDTVMWHRALAAVVIALIASVAEAQWHAAVAPPRASLPAVTVDFGYPGPYVPWVSAPITLHATAGDAPFDGYIGFHFKINDRYGAGTPVICRAVLRPHQAWTFTTFARLRRGSATVVDTPRQVFVEWFDRTPHRIAAVNAGTPPWTLWKLQLLPLRVARMGESVSDAALGRTAVVVRADALPDRAQWYAGFSDVIAPLDLWLDLAPPVREAIFSSGVHVVFFGFARPGQQLDALTRTLLPVTFEPHAASFVAPWPYRGNRAMPVATSVSWQPKNGTDHVGTYIVESVAAAWCPEEAVVLAPIPAITPVPLNLISGSYRDNGGKLLSTAWPLPSQIVRLYPRILLSATALIVAIVGWILLRRRQRVAFVAALLVVAAIPLALRARIHPHSGEYAAETDRPAAPGVLDVVRVVHTYGTSPLTASASDSMPNSITNAFDVFEQYEIRTSDTPMLMGVMKAPRDWDAMVRWSKRRELSDGASIRIRNRDANEIALDFESPFPVTRIRAQWQCGGAFCWGERMVPRTSSGTVTIEKAHIAWPEDESRLDVDSYEPPPFHYTPARIVLVDNQPTSVRSIEWHAPLPDATKTSFAIRQSMRADRSGAGSCTFALPAGVSPDATAALGFFAAMESVTISYAKGTMALQHATGSSKYPIPADVLRDILDSGGIVVVSATAPRDALIGSAHIQVSERKP